VHGGIFWNDACWTALSRVPLRAITASLFARIASASLVPDVGSYEAGEPLYELPGILRAGSWECFLDDLDGIDGQREVGGNGEYLLVDRRAVGVWGRNV